MAGKSEFQRRLEVIEESIGRIEGAADPAVRAATRELVELVMELHATGLDRMLELLRSEGENGRHWIDKFGHDDLMSSLLILHGLHPETIEVRVERAIERLRPSLKKRDGNVEMISAADGILRLRLIANGNGSALKKMVEDAIFEAAPDIASLTIEGGEEKSGFVPLAMVRSAAVKDHL